MSGQQPGEQGASGGDYGQPQDQTPAGWYPDASAQNLQRYWDGQQWTEHTAPLQPGGHAGHGHSSYGQAAYDQAGYGQQTGYGQAAYGQQAPYANSLAPQGPEPRKRNAGLIAGIVGGAVVVIALLVLAGVYFFGGADEEVEATPTPAQEETADTDIDSDEGTDEGTGDGTDEGADDDTTPGSDSDTVTDIPESDVRMMVGEIWSGAFEAGGNWVANLGVEESSIVVLDLYLLEQNVDLTIEVLDSSGAVVVDSDDRGPIAQIVGGYRFSPYVAPYLEEGHYTVIIGSYGDAEAAEFDFIATVPNDFPIDDEVTLELDEYAYVGRILEITEAGEYTITAAAAEHNVAIGIFEQDGVTYSIEDPDDSEATATRLLQEGFYLVVINDPNSNPDTVTFAVAGS